jgi:HAD superfamily hydrolase (TIGR01509 family)
MSVAPRRIVQAIIFDFDGVIANSEPLHMRAFQHALDEEGVTLTADEYYSRYLGFDDVGVFRAFGRDHRLNWTDAQVRSLVARKGVALQTMLHEGCVLIPGVEDFVRSSAQEVPLAIASGALLHEIDEVITSAGLRHLFATVVTVGDTLESKPSPAPYCLAVERLRERTGRLLDPGRIVAIEDSRWGLASARSAGLRCVGVASSYPAHELPGAELVVSTVADLTLDVLDALVVS